MLKGALKDALKGALKDALNPTTNEWGSRHQQRSALVSNSSCVRAVLRV